jgi:hypothetical protein
MQVPPTERVWYNDGFNFTGTVPEFPGVHPEIRFTYRIGGTRAESMFNRATFARTDEECDAIIVDILNRHVKSPIVVVDNGNAEPLDVKEDDFKRLWPSIRRVMCEFVVGARAPSAEELFPKSHTGSDSSSSTPASPN